MVLVFKDNQAINTMVELNFYALEGKTKQWHFNRVENRI